MRGRFVSAILGLFFGVVGAGWPLTAPAQGGSAAGPQLGAAVSDANVLVAALFRAETTVEVFIRNLRTGWVRELVGPPATDVGVAWVDPKDGEVYLAYPGGTSGMAVVQRTVVGAQGAWVSRDLVAEVNAQAGSVATPIVRQFAVYITPADGLVNLVGYNSAQQLVRFYQESQGGQVLWRFTNLTTEQLAPKGEPTPQWIGSPVGYVTPWNAPNVAGLDANGEITAVWTAPELNGVWHANNLSQDYGTPTLAGGLSAYVNWGINLTGVLPGGDLGVTWWSDELQRQRQAQGRTDYWAFTNLTQETGGPRLQPDSVTGITTSWSGNNIYGLSEDGRLVAYWWTPENGRRFGQEWLVDRLNDRLSGSEPPVGKLTAFALSNDTFAILGTSASGELLHFAWSAADDWQYENVNDCIVNQGPCLPVPGFDEYAGVYAGTYQGDLSGGWIVAIAADGTVNGLVIQPHDPTATSGSVSATGELSLVTGTVDAGAVWQGQIDAEGVVSGTWLNQSEGLSGTFSGTRNEGGSNTGNEQEPNDYVPQFITVPATLTGTTTGVDQNTWDEDFYAFTLAAPRTVTVTLIGGNTQDIDLCLGALVTGDGFCAEGDDANESIGPLSLPAGTYLIWVSPWEVTEPTLYTLTVR